MPCREPNCENPIAYTFTWPWHTSEAVCQEHAPAVTQIANNLAQHVELHPVDIARSTPPLGLEDCLLRVSELEAERDSLATQLATAATRTAELTSQLFNKQVELNGEKLRAQLLGTEVLNLRGALTIATDVSHSHVQRIAAARAELTDILGDVPDSLKLEIPFTPPEPPPPEPEPETEPGT